MIRQALLENRQASHLTPGLWRLLAEGRRSGSPNLGVAGALALFAPRDRRWVELGPPIAAELVSKDPLLIGDWRNVFQPVHQWLVGPLRAIFSDIGRPASGRWPIPCWSVSQSNRATLPGMRNSPN